MPVELPPRIGSAAELTKLCGAFKKEADAKRLTLLVCCGPGCLATGSADVADALAKELKERQLDADVKLAFKRTGCHGFCQRGPLVVIMPDETFYQRVKPKDAVLFNTKPVQQVIRGQVRWRVIAEQPQVQDYLPLELRDGLLCLPDALNVAG